MMNIICDLDGTLALDHHRHHYLHPTPESGLKRDWDKYFSACDKDTPNWPIIEILRAFYHDYTIYILSGRIHGMLDKTLIWLNEHDVPFHRLQMRPNDNRTDDNLLKMEWAATFDLKPTNTLFVIEDRKRMVEAWRVAGFTCLQVAEGNF
jgi:hypothetical protein